MFPFQLGKKCESRSSIGLSVQLVKMLPADVLSINLYSIRSYNFVLIAIGVNNACMVDLPRVASDHHEQRNATSNSLPFSLDGGHLK